MNADADVEAEKGSISLPHSEKLRRLSTGWDGEGDPQNPRNWPLRKKWGITGFSLLLCFMVGINALSISSAATVINEQFDISDESFPNSYWTVTAWNAGAVIGPVLGLPLMENFGLRTAYLTSFALFVVFVIPQAVAQNYATLVVTRVFAGGFGSVVQNAVASCIGDMFTGKDNTISVVFFTYFYLLGFTLGPTFGSAILQYLDWRWIFYIQIILYVPLLPLACFFIKETRGSIIIAKRRKQKIKDSCNASDVAEEDTRPSFLALLYDGTVRPAYLFATEPVLFFFTIWSGLAVGNVFLASQSIAQTFGTNYGFDDVQAGYIESAMAIGETIGLSICLIQARIYNASAAKNKVNPGTPIPEARLQLSIPASFLAFTGGLFVYAWTSYAHVPWIAPTIGMGLVGVGIMVVVYAAVAYVTDAYGKFAGSAIGAVASVENLFSGFLPLAAMRMYSALGFQWASSLLGFVAFALSFAPVILYIKGPQIRARSKFMTNL